MKIHDDGKTNPVMVVTAEEVKAWLRAKADRAGYRQHATMCVQIAVDLPFGDGMKVHNETPSLHFMMAPKDERKGPYKVYINSRLVADGLAKDQVWDTIGSYPFGSCYEVHADDDTDCSEFVPF